MSALGFDLSKRKGKKKQQRSGRWVEWRELGTETVSFWELVVEEKGFS